MTGTHVIDEFGVLAGPILLTNTLSVGAVHSAVVGWNSRNVNDAATLHARSLPVVAETWDGFLNDVFGQHVTTADVFTALDSASDGAVEEGNVGGGTGMVTFDFKGGIGTSSRLIKTSEGQFTVGVLVQTNFGSRRQLRIAGVPVGEEIKDLMPEETERTKPRGNSIIVVIATDAPLLPVQLNRAARRPAMALGRLGGVGTSDSGDIFIAFSTRNRLKLNSSDARSWGFIVDVDPLFEGIVDATEEAVVNAMVAAKMMVGINGNVVHSLPHDRLRGLLRHYGRLND